jgi:hypothetical protein
MLRESDLSSKLAKVIEQIPKDVLYDFCCSYAQSEIRGRFFAEQSGKAERQATRGRSAEYGCWRTD